MRVLLVFGTRPEAIKMAPVALALQADERFDCQICVTAQHRQMLDQVMSLFSLKADYDLDLMKPGQDLFDVTSGVLLGMRDVLERAQPDIVLVHGDTTTCFGATLAAFYQSIPVAHVEAGLRTGNLCAPFPEEANRSLVGRLATLHFAPTERARDNLIREGVDDARIVVTGNTVIDALITTVGKLHRYPRGYWKDQFGQQLLTRLNQAERTILITGHRRENFGAGFNRICQAIAGLAKKNPTWLLVYPVHMNPNVQGPVYGLLKDHQNVLLIEPLDYLPFVWLMQQSDLVLTDSGGIQEEAPSLGIPVLVMRETTERPEAVEAGTVELVGTDAEKIIGCVTEILSNPDRYQRMARAHNPYGDGEAANRILESLSKRA